MRRMLLALALAACTASEDPRATVYAAASLQDVLREVARLPGSPPFDVHAAGSEVLLRQVQQGAPADLLIIARPFRDGELPDGVIAVPLARTELVLAAAGPGPTSAAGLAGRKVALGDPDLAPAGAYAHAALEAAGMLDAVLPLYAENVRAACTWVLLGEADAVVCYGADVRQLDGLEQCFSFGRPVPYEAALLHPRATEALDALRSPAAAEVWRRHGFL